MVISSFFRCQNADIKVFILDSSSVKEHIILREKDLRTFIMNSFLSLTGQHHSSPVHTTPTHMDLNKDKTSRLSSSDTPFGSFADIGPEFSSKEENSGLALKDGHSRHSSIKKENSGHRSTREENLRYTSTKEEHSEHKSTKEKISGHASTKDENLIHTSKENLGHTSKDPDTFSDLNKINLENVIIVLNKTDTLSDKEFRDLNLRLQQTECETMNVCPLSCLTEDGFSDFLAVLKEKVETL